MSLVCQNIVSPVRPPNPPSQVFFSFFFSPPPSFTPRPDTHTTTNNMHQQWPNYTNLMVFASAVACACVARFLRFITETTTTTMSAIREKVKSQKAGPCCIRNPVFGGGPPASCPKELKLLLQLRERERERRMHRVFAMPNGRHADISARRRRRRRPPAKMFEERGKGRGACLSGFFFL